MKRALPLLLLLILLSPIGAAQTTVRPPEAFVTQVTNYFGFTTNFQTDLNHTWKLSPDDPDQINGSFNYRIAWNSTDVALGESGGWLVSGPGYQPVPGRPGWVWATGGSSWTDSTINLTGRNYTVRARDAGLNVSAPSCQLNISFVHPPDGLYRHSQCGILDIGPPRGASHQTVNISTETTGTYDIKSRWQIAASDPDDGSFEYWAWRSTEQAPTTTQIRNFHSISFLTAPSTLLNQSTDFTQNSVSEGGGYRAVYLSHSLAPGVSLPFYQAVIAVDGQTHERSDPLCVTLSRTDVRFSGSACGNITQTGLEGVPANLTLPFADADAILNATNLTENQGAFIYGGMTGLVFVGFGFSIGGPVGGMVAFAAVMPLLFYLGIVPGWSLILAVLIGSVIIFMRRGGSE